MEICQFVAILLSASLMGHTAPQASVAESGKLFIEIQKGEGAVNYAKSRTNREIIIQVQDENHKPVGGAVVVFTLPRQGASGAFVNGSKTLTLMTDAKGQAIAQSFKPNP